MPWFRKASSDAAVVLRVRAGRRDEFAALVDRYLPVAHAVCYAQLRNVCDAEDAAQDAFIKAYEALDGLREPAKFGPWLLSIVRNVCRNHQRSRTREAERIDAIAVLGQAPVTKPEEQELRLLVRRQVEGLDDIHREALLLHYYGGRSIKEIAALLELSPDAVKKRLQRAREALSSQMLQHLEPAVAPQGTHRDRVKTIMGLLAGVTAAWEAGAASAGGAVAGAGAAGVAGTLASGAIAKIIAGVVAAIAVSGAVLYWPDTPEPSADEAALETVTAQRAERTFVAAPEQTDPTDPADRSDPSDVSQNAPPIPQNGYFIRGRTVDQSGNPVANAAITLDAAYPGRGKHHETKSSDDGWYLFPDLNHTTYMLQATAPVLFGADDMSSHTAEDHDVYEIAMLPAGALDGVVQSKDGTPVPDAMVIPVAGNWTGEEEFISDRWQELRRVRTDADGRFHLAPVWLGSWKLQVDSPTYALYESDYLPADKSPITIKLTPGAHVEGRVVYSGTDTPVPDLKVNMYRERNTVTDPDGRFVLNRVQPGGNMVRIDHDTLIARSKGFMVPEGGEVTGVTIEVAQGGIITGRIYDAQTGEGIPNADVGAVWGNQFARTSTADVEGKFRFTRLEPGTFRITEVSAPDYSQLRTPEHDALLVKWGKTIIGVDVGLIKEVPIQGSVIASPNATIEGPAGSVSGRVVYGGGVPLPSELVAIRSISGDHAKSVESDANGSFSFADLSAGDYWITVHAPGMAIAPNETQVSVSPGQAVTNLEIDLGGGTITIAGAIVDDRGTPIANARISPSIPGPGSINTKTDADGRFALTGIRSGVYEILFTADGHANVRLESVAAGTMDLRVVLERIGSVEGRVVDARTGQPATEFEVAVTSRTDPESFARPNLPYNRYVNESGEYRVDNLSPGTWAVVARAAGRFPVSTIVEVKPGQIVSGVDLVVKPGAVVHAAVVNSSGEPLGDADVFVGDLPYDFHEPRFGLATVKTGSDGTCTIENLIPGANQVYVYHPAYAPAAFVVDVQAGSAPSRTFALEVGGVVEGVVTTGGEVSADTSVSLEYTDAAFTGVDQIHPSTMTDDSGSFRIVGLVAGTVQVNANTPTGAVQRTVAVVQGQTTRVDFEIGGGTAVVTGSVLTLPESVGIARTGVLLTVERAEGQAQYHSPVDGNGRFAFHNVMAGQGTLVVMGETGGGGRVGKRATLTIPPGGEVTHDFDFTQGATVQGTVTINGDFPEVYVLLIAGEFELTMANNATYANSLHIRTVGQAILSCSGPFQFDAVDPREYTLMIATEGLGQVTATPVTVSEGESLVNVDVAFP